MKEGGAADPNTWHESIIICSPTREVQMTAMSKDRHDAWVNVSLASGLNGRRRELTPHFRLWTGFAFLVRTTSTIIAKGPSQHSSDRSSHDASQAIDSS